MTTKTIQAVVADKRYFEAPNVPIEKVFARTKNGTEYQLMEVNLTKLVKEVEAGEREKSAEVVGSVKVPMDNKEQSKGWYQDGFEDGLKASLHALTPPTSDVIEK